jgi:hypothetical protein
MSPPGLDGLELGEAAEAAEAWLPLREREP